MDFKSVNDAFEFATSGAAGEEQVFLNRESGEFFVVPAFDDPPWPLPDDLESERYVVLPGGHELGLGKPLALRFVDGHLPAELATVEQIFSRKGAYARFKALLEARGMLEPWYEYERQARERAIREWCCSEGLALAD